MNLTEFITCLSILRMQYINSSGGYGMKKTWLKRAVLSMVVLGSVTGMVSSVQAADVRP